MPAIRYVVDADLYRTNQTYAGDAACLTLATASGKLPVCLGQVQAVRSESKDNLESIFEN
jgi:hypothetical protein